MPGGFGPRFLLEALFLVLVAVVAGLADLPARSIVLVMAAAWLLTAGVEWAASRERARSAQEGEQPATVAPVGDEAPGDRPRRRWSRRRDSEEPVVEPPERVGGAPHVRVLPAEPDPAAQPVLERSTHDPSALVKASAAPEQPPPPPEPERKPTPAVRAEPPPVERAVSEPAEPTLVTEASREPEVEEVPEPAESEPVLAAAAPPELEAEREPEREPDTVTALPLPATPREWNLWDLERLARERGGSDVRAEEQTYLLMYLRDFASPDGALPADFDPLVRESFGELLTASGRA